MEIKNVKLTNLRNEEHFNFNSEFNNLVIEFTSAALGIEAKYAAYLQLYNNAAEALILIRLLFYMWLCVSYPYFMSIIQ